MSILFNFLTKICDNVIIEYVIIYINILIKFINNK